MLFLINSNGVPSLARIIKVGPGAPANAIEDSRFYVRQLYYDLLDREPEAGGWELHTRRITQCLNDARCRQQRRIETAREFFDSQEFQQRFPSVVNPGGNPSLNNPEFVTLCYRLFLKREPDPAGLNSWLNNLNQANDYNVVLSGILNSTEYRARFGEPEQFESAR
jgi:hypothetical protein